MLFPTVSLFCVSIKYVLKKYCIYELISSLTSSGGNRSSSKEDIHFGLNKIEAYFPLT